MTPARPRIRLGVDTLCWHLRLERGAETMDDVLDAAAALGAESVTVNLHHLRRAGLDEHRRLAERAHGLGLALLASGDFVGAARRGDHPAEGRARQEGWLERAAALGSPFLRVASGFYRAELAGRPDVIEQERRLVVDVLRASLDAADAAGITLLLENHSDFSVAEYERIVADVDGRVGVFLDLVNPVAALEDPPATIARLAPLARAGHVKDYEFESIPTDDGYHRRGFCLLYRYPGEGVADLPALLDALRRGLPGGDFALAVEGLDNRADVADQRERLERSLGVLRRILDEEV
jgi:sugar phosphate isomerase/epimerase